MTVPSCYDCGQQTPHDHPDNCPARQLWQAAERACSISLDEHAELGALAQASSTCAGLVTRLLRRAAARDDARARCATDREGRLAQRIAHQARRLRAYGSASAVESDAGRTPGEVLWHVIGQLDTIVTECGGSSCADLDGDADDREEPTELQQIAAALRSDDPERDVWLPTELRALQKIRWATARSAGRLKRIERLLEGAVAALVRAEDARAVDPTRANVVRELTEAHRTGRRNYDPDGGKAGD